jgi:zinc D-Ala-D-Ala carboxypeptidase
MHYTHCGLPYVGYYGYMNGQIRNNSLAIALTVLCTAPVYVSADTLVKNIYLPVTLAQTLPAESQKKIKEMKTVDSLSEVLTKTSKQKTALPRGTCPMPVNKNLADTNNVVPLQYINAENGTDASFVPPDLVDVSSSLTSYKDRIICLSAAAADALVTMSNQMESEGMKIILVSGYRSHSSQQSLYNKYSKLTREGGYPRVAPPGFSEHQLGTAFDVAGEFSSGSAFAKTTEGKWINDYAYKYGFILSYPKDEETKTGYMYEPWHLRYVGIESAAILHTEHYTLAFKQKYYKQTFLDKILQSLKEKIGLAPVVNNDEIKQIGG